MMWWGEVCEVVGKKGLFGSIGDQMEWIRLVLGGVKLLNEGNCEAIVTLSGVRARDTSIHYVMVSFTCDSNPY
jgi:hypothetical protein